MPTVALGCCCDTGGGGGTLSFCVFSCCGAHDHTATVTGPGGYDQSQGFNLTAVPEAEVDNTFIPTCLEFTLGAAGDYQIRIQSGSDECPDRYIYFTYSGTGDLDLTPGDEYFALDVDSNDVCITCCGDEPLPRTLLVTGANFSCSVVYSNTPSGVIAASEYWVGDTNIDSPTACAETVPIRVYFFNAGDEGDPCQWGIYIDFPIYVLWDGEGVAYVEGGIGPMRYGVLATVDMSGDPCSPVDVTFSPTLATCVDEPGAFPTGIEVLNSTCAYPGEDPSSVSYYHVCQIVADMFPVNVYE